MASFYSPNSVLHESIFERKRPQPMKHGKDPFEIKPRGKSLFNDIQKQTLSLINGGNTLQNIDVSLLLFDGINSGREKHSTAPSTINTQPNMYASQ